MRTQYGYGAALFWGIVAAGAVVTGVMVAILAGYLLGHYTHDRTRTVALRSVVAPARGGTDGGVAASVVLGAPVALPAREPATAPIGAGLSGVPGLTASVWTRGVVGASDLAPGPGGAVFVSTAGETGKPVDGVWLARRGARPVKVIGGLTTVLGVVWHDGRLFVSSLGRVDVYSDFTGRGFGYHRALLTRLPFGKLGYEDNLRLGPDGRFYMTIGSPCDHCAPKASLSAKLVSFLPDGSDLRTFATGVRGNASLAFAPGTADLYMATNQRGDAAGKPVPDQFGLVQPGSWWGHPTCWDQGGDACRGASRPLVHLDPHAASFGLAFVRGRWGARWGLTAFMSEWTLGKVVAVGLTREGTALSARPRVVLTGVENPGPLLTLADATLLASSQTAGVLYAIRPGAAAAPPAATPTPRPAPTAPGSTLRVSADPGGAPKYAATRLTAKAGRVNVVFANASATPHNVVIAQGATTIAQTDTVTHGKAAASATLRAGTYTFYCSVPGHRQAGMEGTLTVR